MALRDSVAKPLILLFRRQTLDPAIPTSALVLCFAISLGSVLCHQP